MQFQSPKSNVLESSVQSPASSVQRLESSVQSPESRVEPPESRNSSIPIKVYYIFFSSCKETIYKPSKVAISKNFTIFTGKHLCWNSFCYRKPPVAALGHCCL